MKKNTLNVFLLTLFCNLIISYFIGVKYKAFLDSLLTSAIYYQLVVFISLVLPMFISTAYSLSVRLFFMWKLARFKKIKIDVSILDEETKEMYDTIINKDIPTKAQVKDMYEALNEQFRS